MLFSPASCSCSGPHSLRRPEPSLRCQAFVGVRFVIACHPSAIAIRARRPLPVTRTWSFLIKNGSDAPEHISVKRLKNKVSRRFTRLVGTQWAIFKTGTRHPCFGSTSPCGDCPNEVVSVGQKPGSETYGDRRCCRQRFRSDDGLLGSYAPAQTFSDAGQKSACRKFCQINTGKRACDPLAPESSVFLDTAYAHAR